MVLVAVNACLRGQVDDFSPVAIYHRDKFNTKFHLSCSCVAADNLAINNCPKNQLEYSRDPICFGEPQEQYA